MPRLKTRTPRLCRDRQQAYAKIDGQRVQLGRWDTPEAQEAYDRLISEWLSSGRSMPEPSAETHEPTVTEITVEWVKYCQQRYAPGKLTTIKSAIRMLRQHYGSEPVSTFGPKRLRVIRDAMIRRGWARSYVNEQTKWLRRMFRWAASHELCDERIYRRLQTVPGLRRGEGGKERDRVKPVSRSDIRCVRHHLTRPVRALIDLQLLAGTRPGELLALRATDIDRSDGVWTFKPEQHKTAHRDKDRTIYFGPRAQRILAMFMRPGRPIDAPLFSPREANAEAKRRGATGGRRDDQQPNTTATGRTIGVAYSVNSYRRAIHRACTSASVTRWGPHRLRHNSATFLRRQFGLDVASVVLGHSTLAITQTYAELNDRKARAAIACVG